MTRILKPVYMFVVLVLALALAIVPVLTGINAANAAIENGYGCSCQADFSANPKRGYAPLRVNFEGQETGDCEVISWRWDFGDGEGGEGQEVSHVYEEPGRYTVTLEYECEYEYVTGVALADNGTYEVVKEFLITVVEAPAAPPVEQPAVRMVDIRNLQISEAYAQPRQGVQVCADVANLGSAWESVIVELMINGQFEQSVNIGVSPGTSQQVCFIVYRVDPGEYQVTLGDVTGTFYVVDENESQSQQGGLLSGGGGLGTGGIIAIIVILVIIVGGAVIAFLVVGRST